MAITQLESGFGQNDTGGTATTRVVLGVSGALTAGSFVAILLALQDTTKSPTTFNDDTSGGPMTFSSLRAPVSVAGVKLWAYGTTAAGGKSGGSFVTVDFDGATLAAAALLEFSGVAAIGANGIANNTNANPTIALTTQDANNYVIGAFASVGGTLPTSGTGTLARTKSSDGGSPVVSSANYNSAASASSVTNALTLAAAVWAAIAIELRSTTGGGGAVVARAMVHYARRRNRS